MTHTKRNLSRSHALSIACDLIDASNFYDANAVIRAACAHAVGGVTGHEFQERLGVKRAHLMRAWSRNVIVDGDTRSATTDEIVERGLAVIETVA